MVSKGSKKVISVVVGTDFSKASERAIERAASIATEHGAKLTLVHAAATVPGDLLRRVTGSSRRPEKVLLKAAVAELRGNGLRVAGRLVESRAVKGLTAVGDDLGADLVVVGARGRALLDETLGSTAERLLDASHRPVLVTRSATGVYRRIVVACDADRSSLMALEVARRLWPSATIDLLHIYESRFETTFVLAGVDRDSLSRHRRVVRAEARDAIDAMLETAEVRADRIVLQRGDPRVEVARRANAGGYDLVVVARGRSRARHWAFGSVSRSVLRDAKLDVLLV